MTRRRHIVQSKHQKLKRYPIKTTRKDSLFFFALDIGIGIALMDAFAINEKITGRRRLKEIQKKSYHIIVTFHTHQSKILWALAKNVEKKSHYHRSIHPHTNTNTNELTKKSLPCTFSIPLKSPRWSSLLVSLSFFLFPPPLSTDSICTPNKDSLWRRNN